MPRPRTVTVAVVMAVIAVTAVSGALAYGPLSDALRRTFVAGAGAYDAEDFTLDAEGASVHATPTVDAVVEEHLGHLGPADRVVAWVDPPEVDDLGETYPFAKSGFIHHFDGVTQEQADAVASPLGRSLNRCRTPDDPQLRTRCTYGQNYTGRLPRTVWVTGMQWTERVDGTTTLRVSFEYDPGQE